MSASRAGIRSSFLAVTALDVLFAAVISAVGLVIAIPAIRTQGFGTIWVGALGVAALALVPPRRWWAYLVVIGIATYAGTMQSGAVPLNGALRTLADLAITAAAAWLIQQRQVLPLRRVADAWTLAAIAVGVGLARMVALFVITLIAPSAGADWRLVTLAVGMNAVIGVLTLTPLLYLMGRWRSWSDATQSQAVLTGSVLLGGLVLLIGFGFFRTDTLQWLGVALFTVPLVLFLAAVLPQPWLAAGLTVMALGVIYATAFDRGPFAPEVPNVEGVRQAALNVQIFLIGIPVAAWLLAAARCESSTGRRRLQEQVDEQMRISRLLRESQEAQRESLSLLNQAEEVAGMGAFVDDLVNGVTDWSDGMYEILRIGRPVGRNPELLRLRPFVVPEDRDRYDERVAGLLARPGATEPFRFRVCRGDGEIRWFEADGQSIGDESGRVVRSVGVVRDVTGEESYRLLAENVSDIVLRVSMQGEIEWVSPSVTAVLGWPPPRVLGSLVSDLVHPDDVHGLAGCLGTADSPGHRRADARFRRAAGGHIWMHVTCRRILDDRGDPVGLALSLVDAQAEVEANREMEAARARFDLAVHSAGVPMSFGPLDGRFTEFNDALCDFLDTPAADLAGLDWRDFSHPDEVEEYERASAALTSGDIRDYRAIRRFILPDGRIKWGDVHVQRVVDDPRVGDFAIVQIVDVTAEIDAKQQLQRLADHDPVTGTLSRARMDQELRAALSRAAQAGGQVGVMLIDVSEFQVVSKALGIVAGDEVLQLLASQIQDALPPDCLLGRFEGPLFLAVAPACDPAQAQLVGTAVLDRLAEEIVVHGHRVSRTGSVGVAFSGPSSTATSMIRDADQALTIAKGEGRSRLHVLDVRPDAWAGPERLRLEHEVREGLDSGQFTLHVQPQVRLDDLSVCGYEALVRWQHPRRGLLAPGAFLEIVEQSGLVVPLGRMVLREACDLIRRTPGLPGPVSVNVSALELADSDWLASFQEVLDGSGVCPQSIVVELTESAMLQLTDTSRAALDGLSRMGVGVHVDDFGTGFASVGLLRHLPLTGLKIDRSFLARLDEPGHPGLDLVAGIASLALSLGLETIAEGIETRTQAELVREAGWSVGQGYLFGRPSPTILSTPTVLTEAGAGR